MTTPTLEEENHVKGVLTRVGSSPAMVHTLERHLDGSHSTSGIKQLL
jgi:hypothetical protein